MSENCQLNCADCSCACDDANNCASCPNCKPEEQHGPKGGSEPGSEGTPQN